MDLLQSLAGRASGAVERLTSTLAPKQEAQAEGAATAVVTDFATALAQAMTPGATTEAASEAELLLGEAGAEGELSLEGLSAEAAALAALGAVPDPRQVQRNPALLDPEFQARLDRVIERMESEFGHKVTLTETFRTQERQNYLFEQGRTRPGAVVTWTKASNHTLGRAADVLIDGTYDNAKGYQRLAQIAAEEGLRTLGARDPGHIELPGGNRAVLPTGQLVQAAGGQGQAKWEPAMEVAARPSGARGPGGLARVADVARVASVARVADVAQVAQVAEVAQVARVAQVAQVAVPGQVGVSGQVAQAAAPVAQVQPQGAGQPQPTPWTPGAATTALPAELAAVVQSYGSSRESASSRTSEAVQVLHQAMGNHQGISALRSEFASFAGDRGSGGESEGWGSADSELMSGEGSVFPRATFQTAVNEILATGGMGAAERAARIMELQDGAANGPVNHVLLRLDNSAGGEDTIRVDLRGSSVDATIDMRNASEADRVSVKLGDLQRTLERHGLEAESLRVRTTSANGPDAVEIPRGALGLAEAESSRGSGSRSGSNDPDRESWKEAAQEQSRRDPSDPRQRPRRNTPEKENA